jgi:hypothetical protein
MFVVFGMATVSMTNQRPRYCQVQAERAWPESQLEEGQ